MKTQLYVILSITAVVIGFYLVAFDPETKMRKKFHLVGMMSLLSIVAALTAHDYLSNKLDITIDSLGKPAYERSSTWSTARHLNLYKDKWISDDSKVDVASIEESEIDVYSDLTSVYIPTIGEVEVNRQDENFLYTGGTYSAYSGLSGTRVLTPDLLMDVGFVSRIEGDLLVIVKTWNKY